ncbi:hypothetical protein [Sphingorhabdus sp.]|uniref:hypothetical protein n=1 Tax=Sphingorhabdus sp. TaxID=1902408 RepID=UPI003341B437
MPDNKAPYIADDTMRHYDELSQLGKRYHEGDKAVGAVTEYGNKAWGAGNDSAHGDYAQSMGLGGVGGGLAGLLHEALRNKTEQEKNQTMGRKFMRYAGKGGLGALAGAGAGSLYQTALGKQADVIVPGTPIANTPGEWATLAGGAGAALGAAGGGIYGAMNPGKADNGKQKSRLMAALKGVLGGGAIGGLGGAALGYASPRTAHAIENNLKGLFPIGKYPTDLEDRRHFFSPEGRYTGTGSDGELPPVTFAGKAAASEWKAVDLAKNPINWSRTLPKADASAKNWQGAQPGTPAPQVPMTGQQPAAAPPMVPVNQAPPMVPVGATKTSARGDATMRSEYFNNLRAGRSDYDHARTVEHKPEDYANKGTYRRAEAGASNTRKKIVSDAAERTKMLHERDKTYRSKSASLRDFGVKVAAGFNIGDLAKHIPEGLKKVMPAAGAGALGGAALGGLAGLIAPGHEDIYDDEGNVVGRQRRGRFGAAMRGALGGGVAGGLAGGALEHFRPGTMGQAQSGLNSMRYMYNRNTPMPTKSVQTARTAMTNAGEEPMYDEQLGANAAMQAARLG